jgi:hypothetical protein
MKHFILTVFAFILFVNNTQAQTYLVQKNWWCAFGGDVLAINKDTINNKVYLGGNFTYFGPVDPNGVALDKITHAADQSFANPNGQVNATVSDGAGGWFVGGSFTKVGDSLRNNIVIWMPQVQLLHGIQIVMALFGL